MPRMLALATVSQSLALQAPSAWPIARSLGLEITFAAARDSWSASLEQWGDYRQIRGHRGLDASALLRMAADLRRLSRENWDLVQVQTPIAAALWRIVASSRSRTRTLYVAHGLHFQPSEPWYRGIPARVVEVVLARRAHAMALVSEEDYAWVRSLPAVLRPSLLMQLPGAGVETKRFSSATPAREVRHPYVLFCGELNQNKDPVAAIKSVELARTTVPNLSLVIVGDGPLADKIQDLSYPWLKWIRRTDAVPELMAGASALLAPSAREGVPRVIIEALAAGTPVIARSNRGSRELLRDGAGILFDGPVDPQVWANELVSVLREAPSREFLMCRAAHYDVEYFNRSYSDLLKTCLKEFTDGP